MAHVSSILAGLIATTMATATAGADAKRDLEALVRAEVQSIVDDHATGAARTADVMTVAPGSSGSVRMRYYGAYADHVVHKLETLVVATREPHAGWFHAVVDASFDLAHCNATGDDCKASTKERATWRVSGVAIDDHGWKIAAVMWSRALPDAALLALADHDVERGAAHGNDSDDELANALSSWIADGALAKNISASAVAIASGTAPNELARGAGAAKLARTWDGLKLWQPQGLAPTVQRHGSIGFVATTVYLPTKAKHSGVAMKLGAVLVLENGNWRWVSLSFAPPDKGKP